MNARRASRSGRILVALLCAAGLLVASVPGGDSPAEAAGVTARSAQRGTVAESMTAVTASTKRPEPHQPVLILMDVSSSMDETNGTSGESRLDAAKAAVNSFIADLPEQTAVGLDTYPDDADCGEGQTAIPIAPSNAEDMARYVRTMTAQGNTPTGLALEKAAADLEAYAGKRGGVIVLVSDGESNCENVSRPPCDVAEELAAQGFDFTVNTVGLQISPEGRTELQCIAEATAGTYVDVKNPDDLTKVLKPNGVPEVTLKVEYPERVVLVPGTNDTVHITATVTNTGRIPAPNVQATITYDAKFSPGSANPRRRLGNLDAGESQTFDWTFRPNSRFDSQTVDFSAVAITAARPTEAITGSILFAPPDSATNYPDWLKNTKNIIVLGDSYSSGEGVGLSNTAFDAGSDGPYNTCHRSAAQTYAGQLNQLIGSDARVFNLACSGAVTWDYWDNSQATAGQREGEIQHQDDKDASSSPIAAQRDQLIELLDGDELADGPTLIFMTLGGNDMHFRNQVLACLATSLIEHLASPTPAFEAELGELAGKGGDIGNLAKTMLEDLGTGYKILRGLGIVDVKGCGTHDYGDGLTGLDLIDKSAGLLEGSLPQIYRDIDGIARTHGGKTQIPILVPFYPKAFPTAIDGFCVSRAQAQFSPRDRQTLNYMAAKANSTIRDIAKRSRANDNVPVWTISDTFNALQPDHTYCHRESWVNQISAGGVLEMQVSKGLDKTAEFGDIMAFITDDNTWLAPRLIRDSVTLNHWKNMLHPTVNGYRSEAVAIANWAANHSDLTVDRGSPPPKSRDDAPPPHLPTMTMKVSKTGSSTLNPGESTLIDASGFAPGSFIEVAIESDPETLAIGTADADGSLSVPATIRADFPLGTHHLVVKGMGPNGKPVTYRMPVHVERPTPRWWLPGVLGSGAAVLASVVCAVVFVRSRRRSRRDVAATAATT